MSSNHSSPSPTRWTVENIKQRDRIQRESLSRILANTSSDFPRGPTKDALLKEAQELLLQDSIIISPSKSMANQSKIEETFLDDNVDEESMVYPYDEIDFESNLNMSENLSDLRKTVQFGKNTESSPNNSTTSNRHSLLELEKQKVVEERVDTVQYEVTQLENAIEKLEKKETRLKNEKRDLVEREKNLIKQATETVENYSHSIESLKKLHDKENKHLATERRKLNEVLAVQENKRFMLQRELDYLGKSSNEDTYLLQVFDHNKTIEEQREKLEKVVQSMDVLSKEKEDLERIITELDIDSRDWRAQLSEDALSNLELSDEEGKNLLTLVQRETDICLRIDRLKDKYPLEIFLIELKFDYQRSLEESENLLKEVEYEREENRKETEKKRAQLEEMEADNLKCKAEFNEEKEIDIAKYHMEKRKLDCIATFIDTKSKEVEDAEILLHEAKQIVRALSESQSVETSANIFHNTFNEIIRKRIEESDSMLQKKTLEHFMEMFHRYAELPSKDQKEKNERTHFIQIVQFKIDQEKERIERARKEIDTELLLTVEREHNSKKKNELERLGKYSHKVRELEQAISNLTVRKRELDMEKKTLVTTINEIEENYNKEKEDIERQLAEKFQTSSKEELVVMEERFSRCEHLMLTLQQIRDLISKLSKSNGSEEVDEFIQTVQNIENQLREIQKERMEKTTLLAECMEKYEELVKEQVALESSLTELKTIEKRLENNFENEKTQKDNRIFELEHEIQSMEEEHKDMSKDLDKHLKTIENNTANMEKELVNLQAASQHEKNSIAAMKKNLEGIEASYTAKISQVRAQKHHLEHRLELKHKAIVNVKNSASEILIRSLKPSGSFHKQNMVKPSNQNHPGSTYYQMYMKKKDPQTFVHLPFNDEYYNSPIQPKEELIEEDIDILEASNRYSPNNSKLFETSVVLESSKPNPAQPSKPKQISKLQAKQYFIFGPHTKPLLYEEVQQVLSMFQFMCEGGILHKKKSNREYVLRHVSLTPEFTRLLIRDNKKKVPESFIKIDRIEEVDVCSAVKVNGNEGLALTILVDNKKIEFVSFDEREFYGWVDGLRLLLEHRQNLFSLKYNIRDFQDTL